ncbi:ABC transporter permease [Segnochrobactrum spirostomi]|uniref:ABC transporter permease n=1 Tax=Segnochrobactrum spirostomi TaxID=2608987 RepID=A0A6A7Y644_9HYPH|nr:ABC transporter permease [Segnochrobactrum spirostomi]MQT14175.1 ABC transporter permease [Segnochrobactrum spirostomi]
MEFTEAILLTVVTASTPLLIAALGELVCERSGVLNLGVEGMMVMGAACGFAAASLSGSTTVGIVAGIAAGALLSCLFALMVLVFAANQVASGLALTIFGLGLSGLIGRDFVGKQINAVPEVHIPGLTDLPFVGRLFFGEDVFVYASFALVVGIAWFLNKTRAGLVLRAVGDSHVSAHALGHPVLRVRFFAILFGGACAGLAGAYLSLAYTPFWVQGMTAGRGWIALALVVFSSWMPWRAVIGAYLFGAVTILQLHAQGFGLPVPSQLMSALPYLATILVLVLISRSRARAGAPAALGQPFVPDR